LLSKYSSVYTKTGEKIIREKWGKAKKFKFRREKFEYFSLIIIIVMI